jgi:hypothetical protein
MGGAACRPLIAREGLGRALIEPALRFLGERDAQVQFGRRLRAIEFADDSVAALDFGDDKVALGAGDAVILAVPPVVAADIVPELEVPTEFRAIVNGHFRVDPPAGLAPIIGVVNGTVEWLFAFPGRLSVTISAGDRLLDVPRESLAKTLWEEVATIAGLPDALPPWQIVRERRATFAATPAQNAKRPGAATAWNNLFLAGDWTDTKLPATIEGAIRSGNRAADLAAACDSMDVMSTLTAAKTSAAPSAAAPDAQRSIETATRALLALRQPDGFRVFELEADATIPAEYVLLRHYLAEPVARELEAKIAVYLRRIQGRHGGWPLFHDGAFDMSASVKAYGPPQDDRGYGRRPAHGAGAEAIPGARRRFALQRVHRMMLALFGFVPGARCR